MADVKLLLKDKLNSDSIRPRSPHTHPRLWLASLLKTEILFYAVAVKLLGAESHKMLGKPTWYNWAVRPILLVRHNALQWGFRLYGDLCVAVISLLRDVFESKRHL